MAFVSEGRLWFRIGLCAALIAVAILIPKFMASREARRRNQVQGHLLLIAKSQEGFQQADGDLDGIHDFAQLTELGNVSSALEREAGQLTKTGYVFAAAPGSDPLTTWYGIANPGTGSVGLSYFVNQEGKLYQRASAISVAEIGSGCTPPAGATLVPAK